jgi:hypothetical protein
MNLDLTDEQRRQIEAHSACVVPMASVRDRPSDLYLTPDSVPIRGFRLVIPQPWLDATKPCETCGGLGWVVEGQTIGWPAGEQVQCPDCRDGHPIVELRALCPMCEGDADDRWPCPPGCVNGRVSLGRYTVELIAVIKDTWLNGMFDPPPVPGRDRVAVLTKVDHDLQR